MVAEVVLALDDGPGEVVAAAKVEPDEPGGEHRLLDRHVRVVRAALEELDRRLLVSLVDRRRFRRLSRSGAIGL